ncbi:tripartite tricarboxylate transporter substrate binding protein [Blastococcus capsensis]|uniref:tripartite tricarboxylate transporter substrate binding protein n=1 Tax=Blastococcus capsensis TaxID=1564163 RepID=UPI0025401AB7|nr:tripartite tricarboxylate transporter substrate binding protein [Blastococcus capsensis]MDK3258460.1 tripartite tricarboxylate transporter substrate binding protein [Blastococcus capsensis]
MIAATASLTLAACAQGGNADPEEGGDAPAAAEEFPTQPIELVVPYAAGGSSDLLTRAVAQCLSELVDEEVLVENRPGANGVVGTQYVVNGEPDGHRLALSAKSMFAVTPIFFPEESPLTLDDMTVVTGAVREPAVLMANADGPYQTVEDLMAATASGQPVTFGTSGLGSTTSFALTLFFEEAGIPATEVPFEGGGPARTALLGQQVDFAGAHPSEVAEQIEAGTLVPLAIFAEERSPLLPEVPTAAEAGVDVVIDRTAFYVGPPGIPEETTARLEQLLGDAIKSEQCSSFMEDNLMEQWVVGGAEVKEEIEADRARFEEQIAELGIDVGGGA